MRGDVLKGLIQAVAFVLAISYLGGCGEAPARITVASEPFPTTLGELTSALTLGLEFDESVEDFQICVTRVKFLADGVEDSEENASTAIGLVDLTSGEENVWGEIDLPAPEFVAKKIFVKIHRDTELCGVEFSLTFNGLTTPQDIEFKFTLDPPEEIGDGDTLRLRLDGLVEELLVQVQSGDLSSLRDRTDGVEEDAEVEEAPEE